MNYGDQQPQQPPQQQYQMRMNQPRMMQMQMGQMQQHPQYMQPGMQYMQQPMQGGVPMPQPHMYQQQQPQQPPQMANANQQQARKHQLEQLVRSFPQEIQQQIHNEQDHNKKLSIIKEWAGKTRQQQNVMSQHPMGMPRMMPPGQAGGPMYAQPQMPGQPQPMTSGPVPVQRIPSGQGNFAPASGVAPQGMPPHMMGQPGMQPGMMPQQIQQQSQMMQPGLPPQQQPMMAQQHVTQQQQPQHQNFGQASQQAHTPQQHMQHPSPLMTPQSQSQLSQQPMPTPPQAATPHSQQTAMPPSVHSTPGAQSHNSPMPANAGYPPGGPSSVGPPRSIPSQYAGSPMAAVGRPATPSNRSVTSTMSAQQPEVDTNTPEYKAALEKLRLLREPCLKLIDKLKLQRDARWEKSVERVYEIMEGKRPVDPKLMLRLENNLLTLIAKNNVATPLITLSKKLTDMVLPSDFKMRTPLVRDRWACVRHLEIKPLTYLEEDEDKPDVTPRKRKRGQDDATEEPPVKTSDSLVAPPETVVKVELQDEVLEVTCLKGIIRLTPEASGELQKFNFRFDPDFTPISAHSPYVQVLIDYNADKTELKVGGIRAHLVPPLRLLVPREYPKEGASVQLYYDSSEASDESATIVQEMKTRIDSLNLRTISEVVDAWRLVVAQYAKQEEPLPSAELASLSYPEPTRA